MSHGDKRVECKDHGLTAACFVCVHLRDGVGCGYHSAATTDDPWPDAWCDICQVAFEREGEWNETNEVPISLLCSGCYEIARDRNEYVPQPLEPYEDLVVACCERIKNRQAETDRRWGFQAKGRWAYDGDLGLLRFFDVGAGGVVADATQVGSFSTKTQTWLWAWENQSATAKDRSLMSRVRTFGELRGIPKFAEGHWKAEEIDGWEVTQIVADLLRAEAIYRAPSGHLMVFFVLHRFRDDLAS